MFLYTTKGGVGFVRKLFLDDGERALSLFPDEVSIPVQPFRSYDVRSTGLMSMLPITFRTF